MMAVRPVLLNRPQVGTPPTAEAQQGHAGLLWDLGVVASISESFVGANAHALGIMGGGSRFVQDLGGLH
ncbi:hypothetical protein ASE28_25150 [Acidovorax sp. Root219]|nr:hypothetical protein ASE28_25150 [Acidovorax sp. Root219]